MQRALQLAQNGEMTTAPNPMVGAVVVSADGRIIGEGYHIRAGEAHAEVNALNNVKKEDFPLLKEATIYVTLEPCAHFGRTPPCAQLIIKRGLKRCVIGCKDPFSRVHGRGIQMLQDAGIEVVTGVLEKECMQLNKRFICQQALGRPFITLKWAQTKNGVMGLKNERLKISTEQSIMHCHRLRALHQAIVVGHNTLLTDHPHLDVRNWAGNSPQRFVLGRVGENELPHGWQAYSDIDSLLENLYRQGIQSLLVEGGQKVLQSFIERDLWDEAYAEIGDFEVNDENAIMAPVMPKNFQFTTENHFNSSFKHWLSPLLMENYASFLKF